MATAVGDVTTRQLTTAYWNLDPDDYGSEHGDEDLEYTLGYFQVLRDFWRSASRSQRDVLFTVDQ